MKKGYTLLEVLATAVLLAAFLVAFYEGSQTIGMANVAAANQTEAILITRQAGINWKSGAWVLAGSTTGTFVNGTPYTLESASSAYSATIASSSLQKRGITLSWREGRFDSAAPRVKVLKHVVFSY